MGFLELLEMVKGNIGFWARYVSNRIKGVDEEDIYQELLILVWRWWSKRGKVTKFFIQKRLQWEATSIITKYYNTEESKFELVYIDDMSEFITDCKYINKIHRKWEIEEYFDRVILCLDPCGIGTRERRIFELLYKDGSSYRKIAKRLSITKSTVYKINKNKILPILVKLK